MKEQDQIKALAELDGWSTTRPLPPDHVQYFKPYLSSYDAIIPLVQKYWSDCGYQVSLLDTPKQLAESLLRKTGKWKE